MYGLGDAGPTGGPCEPADAREGDEAGRWLLTDRRRENSVGSVGQGQNVLEQEPAALLEREAVQEGERVGERLGELAAGGDRVGEADRVGECSQVARPGS